MTGRWGGRGAMDKAPVRDGGPGSGPHPGGGGSGEKSGGASKLSDSDFMGLADRIGSALHRDRAKEDQLRRAGMQEEANKIYYWNKEEAGQIFRSSGLSGKEFDKRLQKMGGGRRINVKMERLFG